MSMRTFIVAVTGIALCVAACSSYGTSVVETNQPPAHVASVSISLPNSLTAGQTARGVAVPKDASGAALTNRAVIWYSSSTAIASVTDSGVISAVAPGTTLVSAVSEGVSGQATLAVMPPPPTPVATVTVAVSPSSILIGQTANATAELKDSTGTALVGRAITWQSSNSNVAVVVATGVVTAKAAGTAMISALSEGKSASSALSVSAPSPVPVASVSVSPATASLLVGATQQLTAVTRDANNNVLTGRSVTWSSSNTAISTVSGSGLVTAVAAGSATITASSEGVTGGSAISVSAPAPVPVASVSVSPATASLLVGATQQLSAVTRDANNNILTGRAVTWSSGSTSIASVNSTGLVLGLLAGSATITASSEGVSGGSAITVTVPPPPAANPSTVTDLQVSAIDSTSVTLSFTQVNDGTGQPAKYDVRYAVAPISWGSATSTTSGTCKTPVAGTAIGSQLSCTVLGLTATTNYDFQLIAFRGTLNLNAVFGSPSNIVSATTTGSAPPPPPPPPPGGSAEPPGMTVLTDRPFNAVSELGWGGAWDEGGGGGPANFSVINDATAPKSPSSVGQMRYPVGLVGGYPPAVVGTSFSGTSRTLYVATWVKLSTNWLGNTGSGGGKIYHVWINGVNRIYTYLDGVSGPLSPWVNLQQLAASYDSRPQGGQGSGVSVNLLPNIAGQTAVKINRGQWYKWEVVMYGGTAGSADGTVDWWIDGVKVGHYTGIPFVAAGRSNAWEMIEWNPTWGGLGGTITAAQYMWMDHMYISGKP